MRYASLAAVAFTFLLVQQALPGQTSSSGEQHNTPPQQPTATQSSGAPAPTQQVRTPREEGETRADILMARKQYAEAAAVYKDLLAKEPKNAVLLNKLGIACHQQNMLDLAKRHYERAAKADKTYANAYNNIGTVFYQRKKYGKAVHYYKKALAIRTDMAAVYSNLGYAHFAQKHYEEAMDAFHRALALDPGVFERSQHAGSLLQDRSVSDHGLFYFFLAKSYATMGNVERCAHYLKKARDEGYKDLASARTDPAFAAVLQDPLIQEILQPILPSDNKTRAAPPAPPGF